MDAKTFYDEYVGRQTAVGVNDRHRAIMGWLKRAGFRHDHRVLEIGCGIGTLTQLMAEELGPGGSILAQDLSPRSIEVARGRLASFSNVRLEAADVLTSELAERFDVVVLPDVIEHIPLKFHRALFERIAAWVEPSGFVLLHYPNPHHLEWNHEHNPEVLQIIDQPIHADVLTSNVYPYGLYLDYYETYSIWHRGGDYVVAVLRSRAGLGEFPHLPEKSPSLMRRVSWRLRLRRASRERRAL